MPHSMPTNPKSPNKWDVEMERLRGRREIRRILAYGGVAALCIMATALPLWMVQGIIKPLAGHRTVVDANLVISIGVAVSLVVNGLQWLKDLSQKRELKRLRKRAEELEPKLLSSG
jgi:hypothetical protein